MVQTRYIKLVLVGAGGVGKSCIASRLVTGEFIDNTMTIGMNVDSWTLVEDDDNAVIKASIFDLGGQEQFRVFQDGLILGADLLLIVFDITSYESFLQIDSWLPLIESVPKDQWILVANKIDIGTAIDEAEIERKASQLGVSMVSISTKTGERFDRLIELIENVLHVTLDSAGVPKS